MGYGTLHCKSEYWYRLMSFPKWITLMIPSPFPHPCRPPARRWMPPWSYGTLLFRSRSAERNILLNISSTMTKCPTCGKEVYFGKNILYQMRVLLASKGFIYIQQASALSWSRQINTHAIGARSVMFSAICFSHFDLCALNFICFGKQTLISTIILHSKL